MRARSDRAKDGGKLILRHQLASSSAYQYRNIRLINHRLDVSRERQSGTGAVRREAAAGRAPAARSTQGRALTCFWQAVQGLRWFRDRTAPDALARGHGISQATACRYPEEAIMVLADQAPESRVALKTPGKTSFRM